MALIVHKPIKKIDPAFEVKMPGDGKERLYEISVIVKGYNAETAIANFGEGKIYKDMFRVTEVIEENKKGEDPVFTPLALYDKMQRGASGKIKEVFKKEDDVSSET